MSADVAKEELYAELGFGPAAFAVIEQLLSEAGLSGPRKKRIAVEKAGSIRELLEARLMPVCARGDCQARAGKRAGARTVVPAASSEHCAICGGSVNRLAVREMVEACRRAGWARLCIVGGSPNARQEIEDAVAGDLELRLVDGTLSRNRTQARSDLAWADLAVIWGGTQLDHKVSDLYKGRKVTTVPRRGVAELARQVVKRSQE